jgi:aldehyde dehydrogenase (NAD+)/coniferyl-aldehyde dehydrogenase
MTDTTSRYTAAGAADESLAAIERMQAVFARMREETRRDPEVDRATREARLDALARLLSDDPEAWVAAIDADFGHRSAHETRLAELFPCRDALRHARRHVGAWMRPQAVAPSLWFRPARAKILPQPLGVVGIVVPWNYPLLLSISPMAAALAAGNRVMVKMSELSPRSGERLAQLVAQHFPDGSVAVVLGDAEVGAAFSRLPFDHLLFTGSTAVGQHVMRAAAENLTPVTLELGGKSPAIVDAGYPLARAAERILAGKLINGGQSCIAPDYVLLPAGQEEAFLAEAQAVVARFHPDLANSPDYTSIVDERHFRRLSGLIEEAQALGAQVRPLSAVAADALRRRLPPVALLQVSDAMRVMRDEIFGPLLPIVTYRSLDEAIAYVNARPRPLALYFFSQDRAAQQRVLQGTVAGGVTLNDTMLHITQENLPFGGVGPSGMGQYHGYEGFRTFSKLKPVFLQSRLNGMSMFNPPYGRLMERMTALISR